MEKGVIDGLVGSIVSSPAFSEVHKYSIVLKIIDRLFHGSLRILCFGKSRMRRLVVFAESEIPGFRSSK